MIRSWCVGPLHISLPGHVTKHTAALHTHAQTNDGVYSELTDGYALGVSMLMVLTGLPALSLVSQCRHMLRRPDQPSAWQSPGVADTSAGEWPPDVACGLARVVAGLKSEYADERMPLAEALTCVEALCSQYEAPEIADTQGNAAAPSATVPVSLPPSELMNAVPLVEEVRECVVCLTAPREVRFQCGHACCCSGCVASVVSLDNLCPQCRAPLGDSPCVDEGSHIRTQPTFVQRLPVTRPLRLSGRGGRGRGRGQHGAEMVQQPGRGV